MVFNLRTKVVHFFQIHKKTHKKVNKNYFFAKVYDKSKLIIEPIDYASDKSVRGEFVRSVLECELDEDVKQKILMCGLNALKGEV